MSLNEEVKRELASQHSIREIKQNLMRRGYLEKDIDATIKSMLENKTEEKSRNNKILGFKEVFDRVGYGFASQQFVNILFMLSGASIFLIGFMNGIKAALTSLLSNVLKEYSKIHYIGKNAISVSGIIFGFSFLGMAFAVVLKSPLLFAICMLAGSLGIIAHGDLYTDFYNSLLKTEKRKTFLRFMSYFGILITAASLFAAGFIMQFIPVSGQILSFDVSGLAAPIAFKVYGYLLAFEITAIMFILSGYLMSFIEEKREKLENADFSLFGFLGAYMRDSKEKSKVFRKNKKVFLLTLAIIITTVIQVIANSYYGIFIYEHFRDSFLKGFLNVALIFVIALIASISGTMMTKKFSKSLGEAPMLVFGTLLIALLPITFYFNPNLYSIGLATALSVVGGAIVGVAQGLIAERILTEDECKTFFSSLGLVSVIPILVFVTIGAILAQMFSLQLLFLILGIGLVALVVPLYFLVVLIVDKEYRAERRQ